MAPRRRQRLVADESLADRGSSPDRSAVAAGPESIATTSAAIETAPREPLLDDDENGAGGPTWGEGSGKSYVVPALEIIGFEFLLNQYDRLSDDDGTYDTDLDSIQDNLHRGWLIDNDPFATNQFAHPYQGALYHGFARSAGLGYWQALVYDFFSSAMWEVAGETGTPSLNDQITTSFGGSFFGEVLFRMASALLGSSGDTPGTWRELGAALISPPVGINRLAFGKRFDGVFPSRDPATFTRAGIGGRRHTQLTDLGVQDALRENEAIVNAGMDYGLPGKTGYEYTRPFDYFHFEATLTSSTSAIPENVLTRGLLYGSDYRWGESYRGIWGLYGSYDYISPELFSVSSTALSLGTTAQWWLTHSVAMQGTALGGVGWTAVGTIADAQEDRDYHYGYSPQALVELRFLFGELAMFELAGREYLIQGTSSDGGSENENILRGQTSLTVRVWGHHALTLQFVVSSRDANLFDLPDTLQNVGALSLMYTYLGDTRFGVVDWRRD